MKKIKVSNYELFRQEKGISNPQMVEAIAERFPSFGKIQASMVNNPSSYGVQLHPAAEKLLAEKFGDSDYLSTVPKKKTAKQKRLTKKPVWIPESEYSRMLEKAKEEGFDTVFEYILHMMR